MELEIPRPLFDDDEGLNRRNPLFHAGSTEPHIPSFTKFGNNITGNFLRPELKHDGVLDLPRYHPKYTLSGGNRNIQDLEFFGSLPDSTTKKQILSSHEELLDSSTGSLNLTDPPDDEIIPQQVHVAHVQEKVFLDHHHNDGEWSSYYNCCYSPSTLICRTIPGCCYPCTPWLKRIICFGFMIVVNVFLLLLVLAIGLELGIDGFRKRGSGNDSWVTGANNLLGDVLCQSNSTNCLAKNSATGSQWSYFRHDNTTVILSIAGLIVAFINVCRR